jgi:ATP adenylyltransferase
MQPDLADPDFGSFSSEAREHFNPEGIQPDRLWTPWRMRYVGGGADEPGCLFCNRLAAADDVGSLIVHRDQLAFVIMNLFPYNTGHVMLVPNQHVASPETADPAALAAMTALLPPTLRALRRVLSCDGFNLGLNVGAVAGAGVADHLHQHVVPRWLGDANFMPILASTMVLPELIPVTYAKLRAELVREMTGVAEVAVVALSPDDRHILVQTGGGLPVASAEPAEPLWRAARRTFETLSGRPAEVIGWAGAPRAGDEPAAITLRLIDDDRPRLSPPDPSVGWEPVAEAALGSDGAIVTTALDRLVGGGSEP